MQVFGTEKRKGIHLTRMYYTNWAIPEVAELVFETTMRIKGEGRKGWGGRGRNAHVTMNM